MVPCCFFLFIPTVGCLRKRCICIDCFAVSLCQCGTTACLCKLQEIAFFLWYSSGFTAESTIRTGIMAGLWFLNWEDKYKYLCIFERAYYLLVEQISNYEAVIIGDIISHDRKMRSPSIALKKESCAIPAEDFRYYLCVFINFLFYTPLLLST